MLRQQNYTQILLPFPESKRQEIIKSVYIPPVNGSNQGGGAGSANGTAERNKLQVYQKKPKLLVCNDYLAKREESTLIKSYINNIIIQQQELFPLLGTQFRRTPYQYTKYNDRMGAYLTFLQEHLQKYPKIFNDLNQKLFGQHDITNANTQEQILKHPIKKQIFSIGELIDDVTDSSFQNIIQVLDYYNLKNLNPAVLGVSYANMRVLEKNQGIVNELPKLSYIQLGLQQQELNKHLVFFNAFQNQQQNQKRDQLNNIQYISMYHQESYQNEETQQQSDSSLKAEGNETPEQNQNCYEIAMNEYLNQLNKKEQDRQNVQFDELFLKKQQKCPKIIGQSEFLFLFEQVLRLVRHHKPSYIIFSYDFSLTKSHNHYYNLKPDVLGYFCYMLSQISNNHVLFIANTRDENQLFPKQLEQLSTQKEEIAAQLQFDNTTNYLTTQKLIEVVESAEISKRQENKDSQKTVDLSHKNYNQQVSQYEKSQLFQLSDANKSITTIRTQQQDLKQQIILHTNGIIEEQKDIFRQFIKWLQLEPSSSQYQKYLEYFKDKFYCKDYVQQSREYLIQQLLLVNRNLYQSIQEQLNSIFFSLLETINYRKIILKQNLKTAIHVQVQFMSSITEQIRRSVIPRKSYANQESLKGIQKVKWTLQQVKIHDYMNKIKQIRHIIDFVSHSNGEKVNLLQKFSKQNKYTNIPKTEGLIDEEIQANSESMIISVMQKYPQNSQLCNQTLVSDLNQTEFDILYSDQLKVKIMLKRYTQALLNNWVYDLRRKKKIYLHIYNQQDKVDQELKFFYTEHSQYVIDYNYDSSTEAKSKNQIAIYFFNVQRGKHFKNYVLTEYKENQFIQEEIKYSIPKVLDVNWQSISAQTPSSITYQITSSNQSDRTYSNVNQQAINNFDVTNQNNLRSSQQNQPIEKYVHVENLLDLEIFNSSLCITDQFIVKMFGEVINPTTWKQKEFSKMIFIVPRKKKNNLPDQNDQVLQLKLLEPYQKENYIFNSFPRSGCVCVYQKEETPQIAEKIYVFGGISYNGYLCNFIEEYVVDNKEQQLLYVKVRQKTLAQKTFRPLFSPFTFTYNQNVYFLGGEIDKNLILRGFNQVYLQQYSLKDQQFKFIQTLKRKEIISKLNLTSMDNKQHQKEFLKFAEIIPFYAVNLNTYYDEDNQHQYIALLGKCNSAIEQILEKTTVIEVQLENLVHSLDPNKKLQIEKYIKIETTLEDEKVQELRLNEYNSSKTFFLSSFQADQSTLLSSQNKTSEQQKQQPQANSQSSGDEKTSIIKPDGTANINEKTVQNRDTNRVNQEDKTMSLANQNKLSEQQKQESKAISQQNDGQNQQSTIQNTFGNDKTTISKSSGGDKDNKTVKNKDTAQSNNHEKTKKIVPSNNKSNNYDEKLTENMNSQENLQLSVQQQESKKLESESEQQSHLAAIQEQSAQNTKGIKKQNCKDLVDKINYLSKDLKFESKNTLAGQFETTGKASYLNPVQSEYYYTQEEKQIPKYFLVQNHFSKIINILIGDNTQNQFQIAPKFQLTIRFNDEDFKESLLSNQMHFLTYYLNMEKRVCVFYKSLSFEECTELSQSYPNFRSFNSVYKCQVKFDQQKLTVLSLQDEALDTLNENLVNRYVVCDQEYIYLINGTDFKDPNIPYNKLSPCERISIKTKVVQKINDCIYLDCKKSQILQNNNYIFYIGLYENQEELENEDENMETEQDEESEESENEDEQSEQLIVQIFDKKNKVWRVIRLSQCKEINNKFTNFTFLLGNQENKIFAINTKFSNKKKDSIANHELTFDLNNLYCTEEIQHLPFNWKAQKSVEIIRSLYYSATAYAILPTNPVTYSNISLIPKQYNKI
ncbi:hypothetical protein ABPG74_010605 [Tetrahymena malaccensis]